MKKLDIFVLKSFGIMFVGTFFICLFIFIMQLLWLYVDELVGRVASVVALGLNLALQKHLHAEEILFLTHDHI